MIIIENVITEKLIDCIVDIAEQILLCGGEVHRAEDSLTRMFKAYNATKTDILIITATIAVTVHTSDGKVFTQTRGITETTTDYEKLHRLNNLSRDICKYKFSYEEISEKLTKIINNKSYPLWSEFVAYSIISASFTLFFGGGLIEALVSLIVGASIRLIILLCEWKINNKIFIKFISSLLATALAYLALKLSVIPTVDNVIIGNIMTLIPGVGLTTALKDLLVGDRITGTMRTIEVCLIALAIAAGYFVVTSFVGGNII